MKTVIATLIALSPFFHCSGQANKELMLRMEAADSFYQAFKADTAQIETERRQLLADTKLTFGDIYEPINRQYNVLMFSYYAKAMAGQTGQTRKDIEDAQDAWKIYQFKTKKTMMNLCAKGCEGEGFLIDYRMYTARVFELKSLIYKQLMEGK